MDLREEFIKEKKYSYFNNTVLNEYALWLEKKLTENTQALQLLQPDVIKSVCCKGNKDNGTVELCHKCLESFRAIC